MSVGLEARIAREVERRVDRIVRRVVAAHFAGLGVDAPSDALRVSVERAAEAFVIEVYAEEIERRVRARAE